MRYILYLSQILRLFTIYRVVVRYGLDELLLSTKILRPLRLFSYITPGHWLSYKHLTRGMRVHYALEELGPIFVKFGQILSTRRDLLPDDIAIELAKLQDKVAPFRGEEAQKIIERAYGRPVTEIFAAFDNTPMAAASIAQVHAARLHNGREVVLKVLRPGIKMRIRKDIRLLYLVAKIVALFPDGRRLRPVEVVAEFEKNLQAELDLMQEGANCALLKRNFKDSNLLYVPEVEWDYTLPHVMVTERVQGIPVSDVDELKRRGVNLRYLAEIGVEIFFTQVFNHNFFHADMHPGNIFVNVDDPQRPYYIAVDFGIMGTLSTEDQHYLAENFLAFFQRDYNRVAELHIRSEWVPASTRVEEFEGAIRSVCEPIFDRPIKEISFGLVLLRLFQTARRFNMEVQPQLVLLQKTLLNIEGLGRQLYPDLDLWRTAKPFLEKWMDERVGVRALIKGIRSNLPLWAEKLPDIPLLFHNALSHQQVNSNQLKKINQELVVLRKELQRQHQHSILVLSGGIFLICASIIMALDVHVTWDYRLFARITGSIGIVLMLMAWLKK